MIAKLPRLPRLLPRPVTAVLTASALLGAAAASADPRREHGPAPRDEHRAGLSAAHVVGVWDWYNRLTVELSADGLATASNRDQGQWYWVDASRAVVVIVWRAGWVETLILSGDANRLEGRGLTGAAVSGTRRAVAPLVPALPPPAPTPPSTPPQAPAVIEAKYTVNAGPIWNNQDAGAKCPSLCAPPARWNGQWWTTVQGQMSVCECVGPMLQAPAQPVYAAPPAQPVFAPPAPPPPVALTDEQFRAFMGRLHNATFKDAQLAALRDETNAGAHWTARQVIEVMKELNFGDTQVKGAVIMWPSVVDPQNFPEVAASMTFESDRKKLRKALGK